MDEQARLVVAVELATDVAAARREVRALAAVVGFDTHSGDEIALAVSELASNLVRHARGGTLTLSSLTGGERRGIQVESVDSGPGIADVEEALRDGFSTAGSLGYGLGVVNRLMDSLDITSQRGRGTYIVARRWLRPASTAVRTCPLAFGAASRPHAHMTVNGDAFVIQRWDQSALVGVIDGLGHGQFAQRAAQTARHYVDSHFDQPLEAIFRGVGRSCRATRGVVMALARFDWGQAALHFASIGNVEARVFGSPVPLNFVVRRGVLGGSAPSPAVTTHPWMPHYVFVLYSDGLVSRWQWADVQDLVHEPAPALAAGLLDRLKKADDDATVVVVRGAVS